MDRSSPRLVVLLLAVLVGGACGGPGPSTPTGGPTLSASPAAQASQSIAPSATSTEAPSLEARLDAILGTGFNGSALVSKDGKVVYAKGLGMADAVSNLPNTPETRFRIGSITKQFTAMAILILESRGLVTQSDPVCDYLDTCPKGWEAIQIEHLLAHTAGIANFTDQADFDGMQPATPAETVASVADIPLQWEPGRFFSYTNTGYVLLGMVIEQVSGTTYEAFLQDEIFGPLEMKDSGYEHGDTTGLATGYSEGFTVADPLDMSVPYAAGGLYSTVLDLQRWVEAISTDRLAPTADMARFAAPIAETTDQMGFAYGYGQLVGDDQGSRVVWHNGGINGFYTQLTRYPDDDVSIVLLTNRESSPDLWSLARAIKRALDEGT